MTTKQLRTWLFEHSLEDQWWVCLDGVMEDEMMTLASVEEMVSKGEFFSALVLHVSQAEIGSPPWVELEAAGLGGYQSTVVPAMVSGGGALTDVLAGGEIIVKALMGIVFWVGVLFFFWLCTYGLDNERPQRARSSITMEPGKVELRSQQIAEVRRLYAEEWGPEGYDGGKGYRLSRFRFLKVRPNETAVTYREGLPDKPRWVSSTIFREGTTEVLRSRFNFNEEKGDWSGK